MINIAKFLLHTPEFRNSQFSKASNEAFTYILWAQVHPEETAVARQKICDLHNSFLNLENEDSMPFSLHPLHEKFVALDKALCAIAETLR